MAIVLCFIALFVVPVYLLMLMDIDSSLSVSCGVTLQDPPEKPEGLDESPKVVRGSKRNRT